MGYRRRRLTLNDKILINKVEIFNNDVHFSGGGPDTSLVYYQIDEIQGDSHPWNNIALRKRWNVGGPCLVTHAGNAPYSMDVETHTRKPGTGGVRQSYEGSLTLHPNLLPTTSPNIPLLPFQLFNSTLTAVGTKAWAESKPTASRGGLGQAFGELHQLPKNPLNFLKDLQTNLRNLASGASGGRSIKNILKGGAGEHLNFQFGILPMVKDVQDLIKNVRDLDRNLDQLRRDNGRPVRRRRHIAGSSSYSIVESDLTPVQAGASMLPTLAAGFFTGSSRKTVITQSYWDYVFTARFRYFIDWQKADAGNLATAAQISRMLLGLDVSPATLYELMPWSWLIDWFTNLGSVVSNLTNDQSDHLVADYAYVTGKYTSYVDTIIQPKLANCPNENVVIQGSSQTEVLKRINATPYGFGLTFQDLSPKQLGILGALGLTKLL
jgi:hypothetical protein